MCELCPDLAREGRLGTGAEDEDACWGRRGAEVFEARTGARGWRVKGVTEG